ncbi:TfuA-related McrA-glycine thioamidation protein [Methanolobus sp. ZRKC3]|uniref:TfuA-related McrA-glycine thioamidation protein n=1 Tax=Methanolobus sp. ZRKC3 TaxID=3125786 RepID=UPI003247C726
MSDQQLKAKKALVFVGTSISQDDAREILDVTYWPPISRGDIERAAQKGYDLIGIIDGIFFSRAAVAHKEVIKVIDAGATVIGGCSMGALRASELDIHGMIGVGKIYQWYRDGVIEDDDEVAVATNPDTFEAVSNPMVNIRETLKAAFSEGIISEEDCNTLTSLAKKTHYTERSYFGMAREAVKKDILSDAQANELFDFCREHEVDIKRSDAIEVLEKIKIIMQQ